MDLHLRKLESRYRAGDVAAGAQLLAALVRSGYIPEHHAQLAAVYQHPAAMALYNEPAAPFGKRDEEKILPVDRNDFSEVFPWTCEVYQRRLLALAMWASREVEIQLDTVPSSLQTLIIQRTLDHINGDQLESEERYSLANQAALRSNTYLNMSYANERAQNRLWLCLSATIRSTDCNNIHGMISDSGPAWACAAVSHLEDYAGNRDPMLPENVEDGFGPTVIEAAYIELAKELVPWLLDPFPA